MSVSHGLSSWAILPRGPLIGGFSDIARGFPSSVSPADSDSSILSTRSLSTHCTHWMGFLSRGALLCSEDIHVPPLASTVYEELPLRQLR